MGSGDRESKPFLIIEGTNRDSESPVAHCFLSYLFWSTLVFCRVVPFRFLSMVRDGPLAFAKRLGLVGGVGALRAAACLCFGR